MSVELAACMHFKFFNVTFCTHFFFLVITFIYFDVIPHFFFALLHLRNKKVTKFSGSTICVLLAPTLAKFSQAHKGNL